MLTAWIDPVLRDVARVRAKDAGVSLSDFVSEAIRRHGVELDMERLFGRKRCRHCIHDEHAGMCTARNGGTAYPCPCVRSSCGVTP